MSAETWPRAEHLYLSPHLDDAVLSCGGRIARQRVAGASVAVATFFTASRDPGFPITPLMGVMARAAGISVADDLAALRRQEDERALAELGQGIAFAHLDLPDAMFRVQAGSPVYRKMDDVLGPVREGDPGRDLLATVAAPPADCTVYVPLGRGHADHILLREWADANLDPASRVDYEDYPYDPGQPVGECEEIRLTAEERDRKLAAIRCYRSQLRVLWSDEAAMERQMRARAERYWRR